MGSLLRWQKEHHPGITEQATRTPTPRQRDDVPLGSSLGSVDPDDSESDLFSEASTNGESALGFVEPDDSESDLFSEASTNGESADYTDILDDMTPPMEQHDDVHSTNGESADYTDIFDDMTPPMEPRTWKVEHDNGCFEVERIPYQHINYGDARATGSLCGLRRVVSDRLQTNSLLPPPPTDGTSLYLYRGAALSEYSPLEYAVCVSVRKKEKEKKNKDSICGPVPSPRLDFDADHPSAEIYTQHLLTRYRIPKVSERPPPAPRRDDTDTSSEKRRRFAEWYRCLLWPWKTGKIAREKNEFGRATVFTWDEAVLDYKFAPSTTRDDKFGTRRETRRDISVLVRTRVVPMLPDCALADFGFPRDRTLCSPRRGITCPTSITTWSRIRWLRWRSSTAVSTWTRWRSSSKRVRVGETGDATTAGFVKNV